MDYDDLEKKWLFVAYSAKKDGTEDIEDEKNNDYRNRIKQKRVFAGAKGVGRFSCDRLGSTLNMTTIKKKQDAVAEYIKINWEDFEQDSKKEFMDVNVEHKILDKTQFDIEHGTILEISGLRDKWDRESLKKLKRHLEKLINPSEESNNDHFSIEIIVKEEIQNDVNEKNKIINRAIKDVKKENREFHIEEIAGEIESNQVNGKVKNSLFETLGIKTTQIITKLSNDGNYIETSLIDQGYLIYKIKESNIYGINSIIIHLFYLNPSAKSNFTRLMGIQPFNYGSIFVYKNGFRIYPFGEPGEDIFYIDRRKGQGHARYLGTRELIGRIEIVGDTEDFKETTSRDGGFIKNNSYYELEDFFKDKALKRLEKYVVDIVKWGSIDFLIDEIDDQKNNSKEIKDRINEFIKKTSNTGNILEVEYGNDFLDIIKEKQKNSVSSSIKEIRKEASQNKDIKLVEKIDNINKEFKNIIKAKDDAEHDVEKKSEMLKSISQELEVKKKQNLFLQSVSSLDFDNILSLHHQIGIYANDIDAQLEYWNRYLNRNKKMSQEDIRLLLEKIGLLNKKILSVSKFATKANFNLQSEQIEADIILFIKQYIENIFMVYSNNSINIEIISRENIRFVKKFKPIELTIVIDNMISNSRKANARNIKIDYSVAVDKLLIKFVDDGKGIDKAIKEVDVIFEKGFTTTSGSGIGLYHVRKIIEQLNGQITVNRNVGNGVEFSLEVHK